MRFVAVIFASDSASLVVVLDRAALVREVSDGARTRSWTQRFLGSCEDFDSSRMLDVRSSWILSRRNNLVAWLPARGVEVLGVERFPSASPPPRCRQGAESRLAAYWGRCLGVGILLELLDHEHGPVRRHAQDRDHVGGDKGDAHLNKEESGHDE